jgi:DNA repair exonuclease SbcCD ATPase subunit
MAEQSIACPSCGKKVPLTRALRAEIETSLKAEFGERERELREVYERKLEAERERVEKDAAKRAEKRLAQEFAVLKEQLKDQAQELDEARRVELALRKREQALERKQADLEVTIVRTLAEERAKLIAETKDLASKSRPRTRSSTCSSSWATSATARDTGGTVTSATTTPSISLLIFDSARDCESVFSH